MVSNTVCSEDDITNISTYFDKDVTANADPYIDDVGVDFETFKDQMQHLYY